MDDRQASDSNLNTWLMLFAILLLLIGGGATLYLFRVQQVERMQRELDRVVMEEMRVVKERAKREAQRDRMERMRESQDQMNGLSETEGSQVRKPNARIDSQQE